MLDVRNERRIEYCLADSSPYAVCVGGRKVAGFALRRYPRSWLVQGSLLLRPLPGVLARALPQPVTEMLAARAASLSEEAATPVDEDEAATQWLEQWGTWWEALLLNEEISVR